MVSFWRVESGIPEGAGGLLLGPIIFILWGPAGVHLVPHAAYTKPLEKIIGGFKVRCFQYADDTQIYCSLTAESDGFVEVLKGYLQRVRR